MAASQIQRAWRRHGWVAHLRSLGQADREKNVILLQRAWRASACRRFYRTFREAMQRRGESLRSHLIPPATHRETDSAITHGIVLRLGISSFPFGLYYRAGESPSPTKGPVSPDGTQRRMKETERGAEVIGGGWGIVEREKFTGYVRGQMKLNEEARRRRTSEQFKSARRHSTNDDAGERRRERLRKMSRRKYKWFYDNERGDQSDGESMTNFNEKSVNGRSQSDSGASNEVKFAEGDSESEVLTWLRDLDMGNSHED